VKISANAAAARTRCVDSEIILWGLSRGRFRIGCCRAR
jgi:hypothetical protein